MGLSLRFGLSLSSGGAGTLPGAVILAVFCRLSPSPHCQYAVGSGVRACDSVADVEVLIIEKMVTIMTCRNPMFATGLRLMRDAFLLSILASLGILAVAQSNPAPFLNQPLVPMTVAPGGTSFVLTVNGTGLVPGSVVNWNGRPLQTNFINGSQLTATVPALDIATATTASISVLNPAPGGGTSNIAFLDVTTQAATLNFASPSQDTSFGLLQQAIMGDFNKDGKLDIAYFGTYEDGGPWAMICVNIGLGDGTFSIPLCSALAATTQGVGNLISGDFNGDGNLDLAFPNFEGPNTVSIYLGNGDGTLQSPIDSTAGPFPYWIETGDFNKDGNLDLAVLYGGSPDYGGLPADDEFWILLGNGDGTFQTPLPNDLGFASNLVNLAVGDFNDDGILDVVVGDQAGGIYFMGGNGDGTFNAAQPASTVGQDTYGMTSADLNGDGKLDLVLTNSPMIPTLPGFSVLIGNGDGTFQPSVSYAMGSTSGGVSPPSVIDLNGDGKLDVIVSQGLEDTGAGQTASIFSFLGNGDGTFQNPINLSYPTGLGIPSDWSGLLVGDFNADGRADVVSTTFFQVQPQNALLVSMLQGFFPVASPFPLTLSFATQAPGTTSNPQAITLTNSGNALLDVSAISVTGANAADFSETNACGASLAPNANCLISVTFTPTELGASNASLTITDNGPGKTQTVVLAGNGGGAVVSSSPASLTFPNQYVGTSGPPQTVAVTNTGITPLSITNVTASISDFGTLSNCINAVPPGANCTINVFFNPTVSGARQGTLFIADNAAGSPQTVVLVGTGEDFLMNPSGSSSATVSAGQTASYTITLSPEGGFNQAVALTCSGAPAQSTCSLSSSSITLDGASAASVNVTVTTAGSAARLSERAEVSARWPKNAAFWLSMCGVPSLAFVRICSIGLRRQQGRALLRLLLLGFLVAGLTMTGCGGTNNGGGRGGTRPGTYNLSVTGSFSSGTTSLTHTSKLILVVQ